MKFWKQLSLRGRRTHDAEWKNSEPVVTQVPEVKDQACPPTRLRRRLRILSRQKGAPARSDPSLADISIRAPEAHAYIPRPPDGSLGRDATEDKEAACREAILKVFPNMCPDHLSMLGGRFDWNDGQIVSYVLDEQEADRPYPKWDRHRKRKRTRGDSGAAIPKMNYEKDRQRLDGKDALFMQIYTRAAWVARLGETSCHMLIVTGGPYLGPRFPTSTPPTSTRC